MFKNFIYPLATSLFLTAASAEAVTYNNMFLSFESPALAKQVATYAKDNKLGGFIMWTIDGDMPKGAQDSQGNHLSLLDNLNTGYPNTPTIMAFWSDWSVYPQGPGSVAYGVPGATKDSSGSGPVINTDMQNKLDDVNVIAYAFMETEPKTLNGQQNPNVGSVYFYDPWSDLTDNDAFCQNGKNSICDYVAVSKGMAWAGSNSMGNFEAFAQLTHSANNPLGKLNKVISIGGYSHDASFETIFNDTTGTAQQNFINSVVAVLNNYKLDGVDLDYENPNMTQTNSQNYLNLIKALSAALPAGKFITLDVLADPAYLNGQRNGSNGFASGVLAQIAVLPNVRAINLMTYDFHGAFDYNPDPLKNGRTGFLTNLYYPTDSIPNYDPQFAIDTSVQALLTQIKTPEKIIVGVPAYARALANVPQGNYPNAGLFQPMSNTMIIPQGQLDPTCDSSIPSSDPSKQPCNGMYNYNYIVNHMLNNGFTLQNAVDSPTGVVNGTTAYATSWSPGNFSSQLTLNNAGSFAFNTKITDTSNDTFVAPDYFGVGKQVTYTPDSAPGLYSIESQSNLSVVVTPYTGVPVTCSGTFNFTKNTTVNINMDMPTHCSIRVNS